MKIVITGGHHSSALPVIKEFQRLDGNVEISWFGHKYTLLHDKNPSLEYIQITELGIPFYELHAGKFYKTFNLVRLLKIPFGFFQSLYLLLKLKPDIILSFGGYLAVPVVLAGYILGIKSVTHEQTTFAGYATKFISRFVKKVFISYEESGQYLPKDKVIYTGIPIREEIFQVKSNELVFNNTLPVLYITAGKTGSHEINLAVKAELLNLLNNFNVVHQCGDNSVYNDFNDLSSTYINIRINAKGKYFLKKFVFDNEIGEIFSKSNLLLTRSGAHIVSEIIALNIPAVLVPIERVSYEQMQNANLVVDRNLGVIFREHDLKDTNKLMECLIQTYNKFRDVEKNKEGFKNNAAKIIVEETLKILRAK